MLGRKNSKFEWGIEYYDTVYKIYDKDNNLTGYFFPNYPNAEEDVDEDDFIMDLNKSHTPVNGGSLLLPMLKLNLLDIEEGLSLENVIEQLEINIRRVNEWKQWFLSNKNQFKISECLVYTAREDREMLSIVMKLNLEFRLSNKEISISLTPILNNLSEFGMI
ncbi:MAG: hypothetical protein M3530_10490 [Thermoproteota archaeon]|nr:hypothetical protein [Thermoproteota archaeon]